ncbi:MAG: hypothetical protein WBV36_22325 [Terriglobales bacterium]
MKHTKRIPLVMVLPASVLSASVMLTSFMLTACAVAQTIEGPNTVAEESSRTSGAIFSARSTYTSSTKTEDLSADTDQRKAVGGAGLNLAQLSRRRLPPGPPRGYAPDSYETHWMDRSNGRHALIGALIGFGVGAAIAAKANKTANPGGAIVLVGGAGALIGAAVGANHGGPGRFARHRRTGSPSEHGGKELDLNADSASGRPKEPTGSAPLSSRLVLP